MATMPRWRASSSSEQLAFGESTSPRAVITPVPSGRRRLKLTIAYLGTGFHGFAAQPGISTVGGVLAEAMAAIAGHGVDLTCAGRTDAGVHAWCQVVHCDVVDSVDPVSLARSLNKMVGPAIAVRSAMWAAEGFDARHSAVTRRYIYTVLNAPIASPFLTGTAWQVEEPIDLRVMQLAADPLIGEHDFSSFCRRPSRPVGIPSLVRRVIDARWTTSESPAGRLLNFEIVANAFCHQMVRSLVGTMVEMGRGRRRAGEMAAILRAGDRAYAAPPAPPHGLCLQEVVYPEGM